MAAAHTCGYKRRDLWKRVRSRAAFFKKLLRNSRKKYLTSLLRYMIIKSRIGVGQLGMFSINPDVFGRGSTPAPFSQSPFRRHPYIPYLSRFATFPFTQQATCMAKEAFYGHRYALWPDPRGVLEKPALVRERTTLIYVVVMATLRRQWLPLSALKGRSRALIWTQTC